MASKHVPIRTLMRRHQAAMTIIHKIPPKDRPLLLLAVVAPEAEELQGNFPDLEDEDEAA
jgi:hypothetical protein